MAISRRKRLATSRSKSEACCIHVPTTAVTSALEARIERVSVSKSGAALVALGFVVAMGFAAEALGNAAGEGEVGEAMGGGDGDVPVSGVILRSPQMVRAAGVVCGRGNRSL